MSESFNFNVNMQGLSDVAITHDSAHAKLANNKIFQHLLKNEKWLSEQKKENEMVEFNPEKTDGVLDGEEIAHFVSQHVDKDGNGTITEEEFNIWKQENIAKGNKAHENFTFDQMKEVMQRFEYVASGTEDVMVEGDAEKIDQKIGYNKDASIASKEYYSYSEDGKLESIAKNTDYGVEPEGEQTIEELEVYDTEGKLSMKYVDTDDSNHHFEEVTEYNEKGVATERYSEYSEKSDKYTKREQLNPDGTVKRTTYDKNENGVLDQR